MRHDIRITRFSILWRSGFLRSGSFIRSASGHLIKGLLLYTALSSTAALCASAHHKKAEQTSEALPPPAAAPAHAPKKSPADELQAALVVQLAHTTSADEAHLIADKLESLRSAGLSPTTLLLLRRARKDVTDQKPDDASEDMNDALALQPEKAVLWRSRAQIRLVAGDLKGAVSDLGTALQKDPDDATSWALLSTVEEQRKDGKAALKAWQKVLSLNPTADKNHKRLDALHILAYGQPT
ncbi:hypothetical protein JK172_04320 [Acetobacter thailandicus]|nr:hypothetical protein [Acetobacter thailandicus]